MPTFPASGGEALDGLLALRWTSVSTNFGVRRIDWNSEDEGQHQAYGDSTGPRLVRSSLAVSFSCGDVRSGVLFIYFG